MYTVCVQQSTDETTMQWADAELLQALNTWIMESALELKTEWVRHRAHL